MLESAELGTAFESSEDEFFRGVKSEDAAAWRCVKGARVEDVTDGVIKYVTPWSRPLTLVTGKGVTR